MKNFAAFLATTLLTVAYARHAGRSATKNGA